MKKSLVLAVIGTLFFFWGSVMIVHGEDISNPPQGEAGFVKGEVIVGFVSSVSSTSREVHELIENNGGKVKRVISDKLNIVLVEVPVGEERAFIERLRRSGIVKYAEFNYTDATILGAHQPNDPDYASQWHYPQINCPMAWGITMGEPDITVALMDTGVDYNHPDLAANMWQDSAGNYGKDFAAPDSDPMDEHGHGTFSAGIIGAVMDNDEGGTGIAPGVKIMSVKIFRPKSENGNGDIGTCSAEESIYSSGIAEEPEGLLEQLRELRNKRLNKEYVDLYYKYDQEIKRILVEEPSLAFEAAWLIVAHMPAVEYILTGTGENYVLEQTDIEEITSFLHRLKTKVDERQEEIGISMNSEIKGFLTQVEEQFVLAKDKTVMQAFQESAFINNTRPHATGELETNDAWIIDGIIYAADNGANIINMSFGSYQSNLAIKEAIDYAYGKGCLLVASVGNDGDSTPVYPAAYANVIAVSSIDYEDQPSDFGGGMGSNHGNEVELTAPGGGDLNEDEDCEDENEYIYSTLWDNIYGEPGWAGTSFATSHVSGVAALVWSVFSDGTNEEIRARLQETADDLGAPGRDEYFGYGRVNAFRAVNRPPVADAGGPYETNEGSSIEAIDGSASDDPDGDITLYEWDFDNDGVSDLSATSPTESYSYIWGDDHSGTVKLRVTDEGGLTGTDTVTITVLNVPPTISAGSSQAVFAGDVAYFSGSFSDPGWLDTHTADWEFGDGPNEAGDLTEENDQPDATGTVSGSHVYYDAGTYEVALTVTDKDGGKGVSNVEITVKAIPAQLNIDPDTLNLTSNGRWITGYIDLPPEYDESVVDISTVKLAYNQNSISAERGNLQDNLMMVKFDRDRVQALFSEPMESATLLVTGKVFKNGGFADFEGSDIVKVITKSKGKDKK